MRLDEEGPPSEAQSKVDFRANFSQRTTSTPMELNVYTRMKGGLKRMKLGKLNGSLKGLWGENQSRKNHSKDFVRCPVEIPF